MLYCAHPGGSAMAQDAHRIRVLVAELYPLFRQGLRSAIESAPDMEVVAEAECGADVLRLATALNPDVAVCDANLPDMGGLELTRRLRLLVPNLGVMLMDVDEDEERLFEAVKAGASAHLLKSAAPDVLVADLRRVATGAHLIDDSVLTNPTI